MMNCLLFVCLKIFEDKNIRVEWNDNEEKWYFSVVDVVSVLTDNDYQTGRKYWKTLKMRLNKEALEQRAKSNDNE